MCHFAQKANKLRPAVLHSAPAASPPRNATRISQDSFEVRCEQGLVKGVLHTLIRVSHTFVCVTRLGCSHSVDFASLTGFNGYLT